MNIDFIQGIIAYPASNNDQTFLEVIGQYVTFIGDNGRLDVSIAHGASNYLVTESASVPNAWGPLLPSTQYWLYIDIHRTSGVRTFGSTSLAPIVSAGQPPTYAAGQHWFNTTTRMMHVSTANSWSRVIRVFVSSVNNSVFTPLGSGFPTKPYAGSQVGLSDLDNVLTGRIIADDTGRPITHTDGRFFTTEDDFFVNGSPVNSIRLESNIVTAIAQSNLAKFQVIKFTDFNVVAPANYSDVDTSTVALVMQDAVIGDVVTICIQGHIVNPAWTFDTVNQPLWIGIGGNLVPQNPHLADPRLHPIDYLHVARVLTPTSIIFNQNMVSTGSGGIPIVPPVPTAFTSLTNGPGRNSLINDGQSIWNWRSDLLKANKQSGLIIKTLDSIVVDDATRTPALLEIVASNTGRAELDVFRVNVNAIADASNSTLGINHNGTVSINADDININSALITHFRSPISSNNPGTTHPSVNPAVIDTVLLSRGTFAFETDASLKNPLDLTGHLPPQQPLNSIWYVTGRVASGINAEALCIEFNLTSTRTSLAHTIVNYRTTELTRTNAYLLSDLFHATTFGSGALTDGRLYFALTNVPDDTNSTLALNIVQIGVITVAAPVVRIGNLSIQFDPYGVSILPLKSTSTYLVDNLPTKWQYTSTSTIPEPHVRMLNSQLVVDVTFGYNAYSPHDSLTGSVTTNSILGVSSTTDTIPFNYLHTEFGVTEWPHDAQGTAGAAISMNVFRQEFTALLADLTPLNVKAIITGTDTYNGVWTLTVTADAASQPTLIKFNNSVFNFNQGYGGKNILEIYIVPVVVNTSYALRFVLNSIVLGDAPVARNLGIPALNSNTIYINNGYLADIRSNIISSNIPLPTPVFPSATITNITENI